MNYESYYSDSSFGSDSSVVEEHYQSIEMDAMDDAQVIPPEAGADQNPSEDDKIACKDHVLVVFSDICPDYLEKTASTHKYQPNAVISAILDQQEKGEEYPRSQKRNRLIRKRADLSEDSDDENDPQVARAIRAKISTQEHADKLRSAQYFDLARTLLAQDFPNVPLHTIRNYLLRDNKRSLFEAYTAMDDARRDWDDANPPWKTKKSSSKFNPDYTDDGLASLDMSGYTPEKQAAFTELRAARELRSVKETKLADERKEKSNTVMARRNGLTTECGICFEECPLNRMVQCDGETIHFFCRDCLRSQAETQIGMSKYELTCMSMDGCTAGFSHAQRAQFLDKKLTTALDRIEQEAVLRMAGIENLETCPFCPYAAEYPPVEVDKEFRCDSPKCQLVSCRMCRKETHIPKTCAEAAAEAGLDARHVLEEAMSEALIRRCNKCSNPFVKMDGCNKIQCTKCGTIHCDVCRKTVKDYSHFNDPGRGGQQGQCALFDKAEERHQNEVRQAEEETRKKVVEENPQVAKETLQIHVSEKVQQDETIRREKERDARNPHYRRFGMPAAVPNGRVAAHAVYGAPLDFELDLEIANMHRHEDQPGMQELFRRERNALEGLERLMREGQRGVPGSPDPDHHFPWFEQFIDYPGLHQADQLFLPPPQANQANHPNPEAQPKPQLEAALDRLLLGGQAKNLQGQQQAAAAKAQAIQLREQQHQQEYHRRRRLHQLALAGDQASKLLGQQQQQQLRDQRLRAEKQLALADQASLIQELREQGRRHREKQLAPEMLRIDNPQGPKRHSTPWERLQSIPVHVTKRHRSAAQAQQPRPESSFHLAVPGSANGEEARLDRRSSLIRLSRRPAPVARGVQLDARDIPAERLSKVRMLEIITRPPRNKLCSICETDSGMDIKYHFDW
ncbi:Uu.00g048980.m01.CDS01 [Anthostomella pinea]|uniref:Uu.00g048980.m01.CDS01 n=1 Tax=Anthostomella pinea TaxID=933095 RepID=A0AAI8VCT5_9PEZI|nr:Uu.00g048980.m01.CDS01 [Anthostomella pinea]